MKSDTQKFIYICGICSLLCVAQAKDKKIYVGEEIWLPDSWNDAELSVNSGKFQYTPPSPNLKKRKVGIIGSASALGIKKGRKLSKIPINTFIQDKDSQIHKVQQSQIYKINGKLFKAIGEYQGCIYFKGKEKDQYLRADIVNLKKYYAEQKKKKKTKQAKKKAQK